MSLLHVTELGDVVSEFPEIRPFGASVVGTLGEPNLFLCALGFEDRSLRIPEFLAGHGFRALRARYFKYSTNQNDNAKNEPRLRTALAKVSPDVEEILVDDPFFPSTFPTIVAASLGDAGVNKPARLILDVSVAANRVIMKCLKCLLEANCDLTLLYSEAQIYHPTEAKYREERASWCQPNHFGLERGVGDVVISEEYPGHHFDQLPDCVIVLPTFSVERARAAIGEVDGSLLMLPENRVVWVLGVPHMPEDAWRLDALREINCWSPTMPQYEVTTFDYRETLRVLDGIYGERADSFRLTLCPLGSKMQALGCSLFCYLRPDVKVIYAKPREYNANEYTSGCKAMWMIETGITARIREQLDKVGMLEVNE